MKLKFSGPEPYAVLKFCACNYEKLDNAQHEVKVYEHFGRVDLYITVRHIFKLCLIALYYRTKRYPYMLHI